MTDRRAYTPQEDQIIQHHWPTHPQRHMAALLGRRLSSVRARCARLVRWGVLDQRKRYYNRPWTQQEEEYVTEWSGLRSDAAMSRALKRSPHAIRQRAVQLGAAPAHQVWSGEAVAGVFGVTYKTVKRWIAHGWIKAKRAPIGAGYSQYWSIDDESLEAFVRERPWCYTREKMAKGEYLTNLAHECHRTDPWLSVAEACRALGWSDTSFYAWCKAGIVPHQRRPKGGPAAGEIMVRAADLPLIRERRDAAWRESRQRAGRIRTARHRARREAQRGAVA